MTAAAAPDRFYRVYLLSQTGSIIGAQSRPFASDEEAMWHAEGLLNLYYGVELWQTHRQVGRVEQRMAERA
jgi:hypothetical protein